MKRLIYLGSLFALIASFAFAGGRSFAAHQSSPARATMSVRLCASTPIGVPSNKDLAQGIFNGVALATKQFKARFAKAGMNLLAPLDMDYAKSDGSGYSTDQERQNALRCLGQSNTLGYIGTLNSGAALVSEPILNRGGMAMISPANTNPDLTSPTKRSAQEPVTYNHKLKYVTYYRVVTTDLLQGPAGAAFAKSGLRLKSYYLVDDKLTYGAGLANAFTRYAQSKLGMHQSGIGHIDPTDAASIASSSDSVSDQVVAAKPDGVYFGGDVENIIAFARDLRNKGFVKPILGGDAVFAQSYIDRTGKGSLDSFATSVGPDPIKSSRAFLFAYHKMFKGVALGPYDATAYDAGSIALNAILQAHAAGVLKGAKYHMRAVVNKYVAQTHFMGATGLTTFDRNGDTTNRIISIYAVRAGHWKFIAQAPKLNGISPT